MKQLQSCRIRGARCGVDVPSRYARRRRRGVVEVAHVEWAGSGGTDFLLVLEGDINVLRLLIVLSDSGGLARALRQDYLGVEIRSRELRRRRRRSGVVVVVLKEVAPAFYFGWPLVPALTCCTFIIGELMFAAALLLPGGRYRIDSALGAAAPVVEKAKPHVSVVLTFCPC